MWAASDQRRYVNSSWAMATTQLPVLWTDKTAHFPAKPYWWLAECLSNKMWQKRNNRTVNIFSIHANSFDKAGAGSEPRFGAPLGPLCFSILLNVDTSADRTEVCKCNSLKMEMQSVHPTLQVKAAESSSRSTHHLYSPSSLHRPSLRPRWTDKREATFYAAQKLFVVDDPHVENSRHSWCLLRGQVLILCSYK